MSGGPLPVEGGMVLDMSRMTRKLTIDRENLLAIVSPGVIGVERKGDVPQMDAVHLVDLLAEACGLQ